MWKISSVLAGIVLVLLALGIVMLASTSGVRGEFSTGDPGYYVKRQFVWLVVALIVGFVVAVLDYRIWRRLAFPLVAGAIVLLAAVLVVGPEINGSQRWIRVGALSIQPSEIAKLAVVLMLSAWMTHVGPHAARFKEGLLFPLLGLGLICGLILWEPDYGTTALIAAAALTMMFVGGSRPGHLLIVGTVGVCVMSLAIMQDAERSERILAFLNPEANRDAAFQVIEAKNAFVLGGPFGVGLGNSSQKHFYLPEAHTDFILPIIGEELGSVTCVIVLLFLGILYCGMIVSERAPDQFGRFLAFGATIMLTLQASINVGVVTGLLPTKGLPLPFISYGGSSLVISLIFVGLVLSVARKSADGPRVDRSGAAIKDRAHRI
jgi:cell division protein FtsW